MKKHAAEALVFQDEVEIHRLPALTRMWGAVGEQPEVPSPGQNEKKVVFGGVDSSRRLRIPRAAGTSWCF